MKTFALVLFGLVAASLAQAEEYPASEKFAKTYPVSAHAELSLGNINGSVEIIAWDKNEVSVEAEKRAASTEDLANIVIKVRATPRRVVVETEHMKAGWFGNNAKGLVRYTLHVPTGTYLREISVVNANISIRGVRGELNATTVNGDIQVQAIEASATLHTVNGNIEADVASNDKERKISVETVNGNCKVVLPATVAANVRATTVNGKLNSTLPLTNLKTSKHKLEGTVGTGVEATIAAETVNGDIAFDSI